MAMSKHSGTTYVTRVMNIEHISIMSVFINFWNNMSNPEFLPVKQLWQGFPSWMSESDIL